MHTGLHPALLESFLDYGLMRPSNELARRFYAEWTAWRGCRSLSDCATIWVWISLALPPSWLCWMERRLLDPGLSADGEVEDYVPVF